MEDNDPASDSDAMKSDDSVGNRIPSQAEKEKKCKRAAAEWLIKTARLSPRSLMRYMDHLLPFSASQLEKEVLKIHKERKDKAKKFLKDFDGKLTISYERVAHDSDYDSDDDDWGCYSKHEAFVCISVHFVDHKWKVRKWILGYSPIEFERVEKVEVYRFKSVILDYEIEDKVSTILVPNNYGDHKPFDAFRKWIEERGKNTINPCFFRIYCCSDLFRLMAGDLFDNMDLLLEDIRVLVGWGKMTSTNWNVTLCNLQEALDMEDKKVFALLHHLLPHEYLILCALCVSEMFSSSTLVYSLTLFLSLSLLFFLSPLTLLSPSRHHNLLSPADDLDDLSLFHRAAVSSSNNRRLISVSRTPPPKIAFLFLTNSDLTFLPLWESFFHGHEDLYNAYIHADPSSGVSPLIGSSINAKFIPAKKTARASPTLISAERRLLARAILDDPNNLYFALVSQHCIPLHSFPYIHNHLFAAGPSPPQSHQSFIEILSDEPFLPNRYNARGDDSLLPEIRYEDFRVGSQFFVLAKRHALLVIKERKLWRKFRLPCLDTESCYPEEHYFPTLLSLEDPKGCSHFTLTRVNWTGSVGGHPHTYDASEVSPQLIHTLRRSNSSLDYFFARKFSPDSLQPLMEIADAVIFGD